MPWKYNQDTEQFEWVDDTTPVGIGDFNTDMSTNNPVVGELFNIDSSTTAKYNGDGTYTITNTETGKTSIATQTEIESMINPQTSGNASMANFTDASYKEKLKDPSVVDAINKLLGTKLTGLQLGTLGVGSLMGLAGLNGSSSKPTGYQGGIPKLTATQPMLTAPPTGRRPGSGGINYGTGVQYKDEKGNIVSDTSTPVADLLAAARANPFNEVQTNYGIAPTPKPLAPPTVRAPVVSAAQQQTIDNKAAADAKAAADKAAADAAALKAAQAAAFAKTPEGMAKKIGLTLPAGWSNFNAQQKIDWFNNNNVDPNKLLQAGVSQSDINWMQQHGYNGDTTTKAAAAGLSLPSGWNNYTAQQKIDYFNKNNVGIDALTKAGTSASDLDWMKQHGYTGNAAGVSLPTGFENLNPQQKIDYFNQNNVGIDKLLQAGTSPSDIDWMKQHGYTGNAAGVQLPTGFENLGAADKIDYFNKNNIGADVLAKAGTSAADIDWMTQHGYTGGATPVPAEAIPAAPVVPAAPAAVSLPSDWGVEGGNYGNAQQKIDYFNQNNVSAAQLANQGVSQADIDWMKQNGYKGMAQGGITNLDHGGFVIPADVVSHFGNGSSEAGLKLLEQKLGATPIKGHGDGMSDSIPASIEGQEKALVANEEAYVSPRMVERLGDGDMDEGSRKLKHMMEKIRKARTGTTQQGKQVNPNKFMPGGSVGYAHGGGIKHFVTGTDVTSSAVNAGVTGTEQNLSNWVGPYATTMLGKAEALTNTPYQAYTGPLTAGASGLQNLAFNNAANLTPSMDKANDYAQQAGNLSYTPQTLNFDTNQAQQYMNPYLQASLNPQLEEARRQSEITAQQNNAKMTQAGAFGGGRQAILTAENQRNLGTNLANITGQGYNTAYQNAMGQFNADQNRQMQENQFGANYGLQGLQTGISGLSTANQIGINSLNTQAGLGATQRGIESEGIAADKAQFEEARKDPYTKLQFQQSMLNGLPITANQYTMAQPNALQAASGGAKTLNDLLAALKLTS